MTDKVFLQALQALDETDDETIAEAWRVVAERLADGRYPPTPAGGVADEARKFSELVNINGLVNDWRAPALGTTGLERLAHRFTMLSARFADLLAEALDSWVEAQRQAERLRELEIDELARAVATAEDTGAGLRERDAERLVDKYGELARVVIWPDHFNCKCGYEAPAIRDATPAERARLGLALATAEGTGARWAFTLAYGADADPEVVEWLRATLAAEDLGFVEACEVAATGLAMAYGFRVNGTYDADNFAYVFEYPDGKATVTITAAKFDVAADTSEPGAVVSCSRCDAYESAGRTIGGVCFDCLRIERALLTSHNGLDCCDACTATSIRANLTPVGRVNGYVSHVVFLCDDCRRDDRPGLEV